MTTTAPSFVTTRLTAGLLVVGGLLTAVGGQLHPRGSGAGVEDYLLSMFASPAWTVAHTLLLAGAVVNVLALVAAWRVGCSRPGPAR